MMSLKEREGICYFVTQVHKATCSELGVFGCVHNTAILDYLLELSSIRW